MKILKFGGTSMGDEHTWRKVLDIITNYDDPVIIVSATAHTTRQLLAAAEMARDDLEQAKKISRKIAERHEQLVDNFLAHTHHPQKETYKQSCINRIKECIGILENHLQKVASTQELPLQDKDAIASLGEQLSAYLFAQCGRAYGLSTQWIDARNIIKTDADFGQANPDVNKISQAGYLLSDEVEQGNVPIMGGFYGENEEGEITTLGFEGSDYSAGLVGAALQAEAIEIWTDVSGIYTCDPNLIHEAQPIPALSFQEATELAFFGAKVLHPSTMKPAATAGIPVYVKNIFEPHHAGTKIHNGQGTTKWAKAVTYLKDITILTVTSNGSLKGHAFLARVFDLLNEYHLSVNAVTTTEASVSVALQTVSGIEALQHEFREIGSVHLEAHHGLISLIGCSFNTIDEIIQAVFSAIPEANPSLISYSSTKSNLNIAVKETQLISSVISIHKALFEDDWKQHKKNYL